MPIPPAVPAGLSAGGRFADWDPSPTRFVALDVDGTLVRAEPVPSARVRAAITALTAQGISVGLATGRMTESTAPIIATGAFTGPHVFHNGAAVTDATGEDLVVRGLSDEEVGAVLELGGARDDLVVEVYVGRTYLSDRDDVRAEPHARLLGIDPSGTIRSPADLHGRTAVKAVAVCFTEDAAADMTEAVVALGLAAGPAGSPATPQLRYVNVTRAGVDKGSGVAVAASSIGVDLAAVTVIGDETNDVSAFLRAGTAIAMGDSAPEVVAAAHLVAPTFEDAGAAFALETLATVLVR